MPPEVTAQAETQARLAHTVVAVEDDGELLGLIGIADEAGLRRGRTANAGCRIGTGDADRRQLAHSAGRRQASGHPGCLC